MPALTLPTHIPTNAETTSHLVTNLSQDGSFQVKDATTNQTVTMRLAVINVAGQLTLVAVGPGSS
jgi:hypothetical protein